MSSQIIFNSETWSSGFFYNCEIVSGTLTLIKGCKYGVYISRGLDCMNADMFWDRLKMKVTNSPSNAIKFSYHADNDDVITRYLDEDASRISNNMVNKRLDELFTERMDSPTDVLLTQRCGRYLTIRIEFYMFDDDELPAVDWLRISFPRITLAEYLPEFYRGEEHSFLHNFMSMFQTLNEDLDETINNVARNYEPDVMHLEFLNWFAEWLSIDSRFIYSEDRLRRFIKNSFFLYRQRGTKEGIKKIVEIYTDSIPVIIEACEIDSEEYGELYGRSCYSFTVLVDDSAVETNQCLLELTKIVENYKPAHTTANLVILKRFIVLGGHSYLGVNSALPEMVSFGTCMLQPELRVERW